MAISSIFNVEFKVFLFCIVFTSENFFKFYINVCLFIYSQVEAIQTESVRLQAGYAGDNAQTIIDREREVLDAWRNLHILVERRRLTLADASDYYRFMLMAKDLLLWIDDISRQMNTQEKPR